MYSLLIVLSVTSFWLFSPEALVLIGNGGGLGTGIGIVTLLCFSAITFIGISFIKDDRTSTGQNSQHLQKQKVDLVSFIGIAGMIGTALFASTGILVTAGFTFNEVFYYRFPNFAFAFIILAAALSLQFFPTSIRNRILVITVSFCFAGLAVLVAYGLISEPTVATDFATENTSIMNLLPLLLVFVGLDRVRALLGEELLRFRLTFFLTVMLLAGWMYVSARFVEPQRLIFSTIPYMTAAWKIGGEPGRLIMGMIIILGSLGAVYGLMTVSSSSVTRMFGKKRGDSIGKGIILLMAIAIGAMMGAGVAGTTILELYIRSSLLLWLAYTGLSIFSGSLQAIKKKSFHAAIGMISSTIILLGSLAIFFNQENVIAAALFTVSMIAGALLLITFLNVIAGYVGKNEIPIIKNTEV